MRVVMVSKAFVRGAYQRKLEELAALPDVELTLITPPSWREAGQTTELDVRFTRGYEVVVLPIAFNGHFHVYFYRGLGRAIAERRPDILHVDEEPYNLSTFQAMWEARRRGARTLFFTWQNIYRQLPAPFSWIERSVYRWADWAIAGNQDAVDVLRRKGYGGPTSVIPQFGVDPALFYPQDRPDGKRSRPFVIGFLGRFEESKGLLDLLEACAGLGTAAGDWQLRLIGGGPLRETIEQRATALGIARHLDIRSSVPSTEVPRELNQLDVLVLPSRTTPSWREQFGRALTEAMACAVPVIGSDSGEIPNVIGEAGLSFPEGDVARLRDCLAELRTDPMLRRELAERGRARVLAHYTQAQIAAQTYAVYCKLLGA